MPFRVFASCAIVLLLLAAAPAYSHFASTASTASTASVAVQTNESVAGTQLAGQLPADLRFDDLMGTAQVAHLPFTLDMGDAAEMKSYRSGDVAYWAPEQRMVVFLSDGAGVPSDGLVLIGHVAVGLSALAGCVSDCAFHVTAPN